MAGCPEHAAHHDTKRSNIVIIPLCDEDLPSSSHSSTTATPDPTISNAYKGPITRARAREIQNKVNMFLSTLNYDISEHNLLPNSCPLLVPRFEGIASLKIERQDEELAGRIRCLWRQPILLEPRGRCGKMVPATR